MRFLHREVHGFEDATRNFEQAEPAIPYRGRGAPTFIPSEGSGALYVRTDTPTVANQRIYIWNPAGPAWVGIV